MVTRPCCSRRTLILVKIDQRRDFIIANHAPGLSGIYEKCFILAFDKHADDFLVFANPRTLESDAWIAVRTSQLKQLQDLLFVARLSWNSTKNFIIHLGLDARPCVLSIGQGFALSKLNWKVVFLLLFSPQSMVDSLGDPIRSYLTGLATCW